MDKREKVVVALQNKQFLKVIAGINNFDLAKVKEISSAANLSGATAIDICADEEIIENIVALSNQTAVCVSSIEPKELRRAEELGAEILELGNFEALHEQGVFPSAEEVLAMTREILAARKTALVSITVPGHLELVEQIKLAQDLEALGVDMIQTEGKETLANTAEFAKVLSKTFIMTASGIKPETTKDAIAAGAHGIGVGKFVSSSEDKVKAINLLTSELNIASVVSV